MARSAESTVQSQLASPLGRRLQLGVGDGMGVLVTFGVGVGVAVGLGVGDIGTQPFVAPFWIQTFPAVQSVLLWQKPTGVGDGVGVSVGEGVGVRVAVGMGVGLGPGGQENSAYTGSPQFGVGRVGTFEWIQAR